MKNLIFILIFVISAFSNNIFPQKSQNSHNEMLGIKINYLGTPDTKNNSKDYFAGAGIEFLGSGKNLVLGTFINFELSGYSSSGNESNKNFKKNLFCFGIEALDFPSSKIRNCFFGLELSGISSSFFNSLFENGFISPKVGIGGYTSQVIYCFLDMKYNFGIVNNSLNGPEIEFGILFKI